MAFGQLVNHEMIHKKHYETIHENTESDAAIFKSFCPFSGVHQRQTLFYKCGTMATKFEPCPANLTDGQHQEFYIFVIVFGQSLAANLDESLT